ncbi:MAG: ABC transporter substrate-binding protein [Xanthobacteraceae bacterium]
MRRREFITLVGMTAASWSFTARAQQPKSVAKIGFVYPGPETVAKLRSVPFLAGLASRGLREREDFTLIIRATGGDVAKVPSLLDELLASKVDLLVISGPPLTRAVHNAIKTLPIVTFDLESDPVESGWLQSYARPGGNLTGVFSDFPDFSTKWLQLLREIVPGITSLVVLWDPSTPPVQQKAVTAAAHSINVKTEVLELRSPSDFEAVFDAASARRPDGLLLLSSPLVSINSKELAELTLRHRLPAISLFANFARAGGLVSYGPNLDEFYRETGIMAAKILKGTKPADLPAERPTRFELIVNAKTAKSFGLAIPPTLLATADEVIE